MLQFIVYVILIACAVDAQSVFAPISMITNTIQYGADSSRTTTSSTATFRCTESMAGGVFAIGADTFHVTCIPPRYAYTLTEYSRIPRNVQLHMERACLVGNTKQFNASLAAIEVAQQTFQTSVANTVASRRLLQFDVVTLAIASVALVEASHALAVANNAKATADAAISLGNQNAANIVASQAAINTIQVWGGTVDTSIASINVEAHTTAVDLASMKVAANATAASVAVLYKMNAEMTSRVTAQELQLQSDIADSRQALEATLSADFDSLKTAIASLTALMAAQQARGNIQDAYIMSQLQQSQESLLGLTTNVFDLYQNKELRNMITSSFFQSRALLDPTMKPVVTDDGTAPAISGQLNGVDRRVMVDSITVNFVNAGTDIIAPTVVNQIYNIYMDSIQAVTLARPWTTFESLLKQLGPDPGCARSYTAIPGDQDDPTLPACVMWIEIIQNSCSLPTNSAQEWKIMDPSQDIHSQPITIPSSGTCVSNVITSYSVVRSINDWLSTVSTNACQQTLAYTYFQFYIQSLNAMTYIDQNLTSCDMSINEILVAGGDASNPQLSLFGYMFSMLHRGFPGMLERVYTTKLKLYGRLPDGLSFETEPMSYTPTQNDTNGDPIYDGGSDPHSCLNAYWLAMSYDTLPIFTSTPYPNIEVTKQVIFTKDSSSASATCTQASNTCFITADPSADLILLEDDMSFLLPSNFLTVGDPAMWNATGVYDVPEELIAASQNIRAGINHVDYYHMPPGTLQTYSLTQFNNMNQQSFDAKDGSISADSFLIPTIGDSNGYPVCNTQGAYPTSMLPVRTHQTLCPMGYRYTQAYAGYADNGLQFTGSACVGFAIQLATQDHRSMCSSHMTSSVMFRLQLVDGIQRQYSLSNMWTITFWLRPTMMATEALIYFATGEVVVYWYVAPSQWTIVMCGSFSDSTASNCIVQTQVQQQGSDAVFVAITSDGAMVINNNIGMQSTRADVSGLGRMPTAYYYDLEWATMFDQTILTPSQMLIEQQCQLNSIYDSTTDVALPWIAPVALCTLQHAGDLTALCRTATLCNGNCVVAASINQVPPIPSTFIPLLRVCDPGFAPPYCLTPCVRVDSLTGFCLDATVVVATPTTGVVPNGKRCTLLKNFQESVIPGFGSQLTMLTYTPRKWSYLTTLTVPSGVITSIVQVGQCPAVTSSSLGDGSTAVVLSNQQPTSTTVIVTYFFVGDQASQCTNQCCDYAGTTTLIQPYMSTSVPIPTVCLNITVFVTLITDGSNNRECSHFTVDTAFILSTPIIASSGEITSKVQYAVDTVAATITEQSSAITSNLLHAMSVAAGLTANSDAAVAYLNNLANSVNAMQQPAIVFSNNLTSAFSLGNPQLEAQGLSDLATAQSAVSYSLSLQLNHTRNLAASDAALASVQATYTMMNASVQAMNAIFKLNNKTFNIESFDSCSAASDPFAPFACAIGSIASTVGHVVEDAVDAAAKIAEKVIGVTSSAIGGLLGFVAGGATDMILRIVEWIVAAFMLLAIVWLVYRDCQRGHPALGRGPKREQYNSVVPDEGSGSGLLSLMTKAAPLMLASNPALSVVASVASSVLQSPTGNQYQDSEVASLIQRSRAY